MALPLQFSRRRLPLTTVDKKGRPGLASRPLPSVVAGEGTRRLTKLLTNVNIENSLGPVQVLMSPENVVEDLVMAAVEIYVREKRRPLLLETDHRLFDLHYSQFSMECKQMIRALREFLFEGRREADKLGLKKLLLMPKARRSCHVIMLW